MRWTEGLQALKGFNLQLTPKDDWHKFKLIKVKLCTIHGVAYQQGFKRDFDIESYLQVELSSMRKFLVTESSFKMMKNASYFSLRFLPVLQIFKFLS